jgi:hypothetical protein
MVMRWLIVLMGAAIALYSLIGVGAVIASDLTGLQSWTGTLWWIWCMYFGVHIATAEALSHRQPDRPQQPPRSTRRRSCGTRAS